ncbi:hypothetical protein PVAP13_9NG655800 [Panicum virgatum]|uniref:Adenylyl-sulfate kinase n=1 Tax=Panicum virgatum TaxID=38727 RepID=A0A8T0N6H7_PANVG|nr:hypothetical protein PVAP13_9NG655800 [Panicum virgatum]
MASLSAPPTLPRASPVVVGAARGRRAAVRVRTAAAALGGGCGGGGGGGMEKDPGDGPRSTVKEKPVMSNIGKSTNILWHNCPIEQSDRQMLLGQKGCVVWITGLSGSGKSTLACALSRELHYRGHLTYVLDGDNLRHGLNRDLSFKAEDRAENIRRVGEVAKLFADAGIICIASLISPYRRDRDACRALLPDSKFIELVILKVCTSLHAQERLKVSLELMIHTNHQ